MKTPAVSLPAILLATAVLAATLPAAAQAPDPEDPAIVAEAGREILRPGVLEGGELREYYLDARPGDRLTLRLDAESPEAVFDLIPPRAQGAVHRGAVDGNLFEGTLEAGGAWVLRVYLTGDAAASGARVAFDLSVKREEGATPVIPGSGAPLVGGPAGDGVPATRTPGGVLSLEALQGEALAAIDDAGPGSGPGSGPGTGAAAALPGAGGMAQAPASGNRFVVAGLEGVLNLRAEPSTAAAVVATARPGDELANGGCAEAEGRTWCEVQTPDGRTAWAAQEFLVPAPDQAAPAGPGALPAAGAAVIPVGEIACIVERTPGRCGYAVDRGAGGQPSGLRIQLPGGGVRTVTLEGGVPVAADADAPFFMMRTGDTSTVTIGDAESYDIPDSVALGG